MVFFLLPVQRVPVHTFQVAVCCLPGNRLGGARRSLVADLGKSSDYHYFIIVVE